MKDKKQESFHVIPRVDVPDFRKEKLCTDQTETCPEVSGRNMDRKTFY